MANDEVRGAPGVSQIGGFGLWFGDGLGKVLHSIQPLHLSVVVGNYKNIDYLPTLQEGSLELYKTTVSNNRKPTSHAWVFRV